MTMTALKPSRRRSRLLTALLTATVAAFTGGQALNPAPAAAVTDEGSAACVEAYEWECEESGVGAGGGGGDSQGGSSASDWPWEDVSDGSDISDGSEATSDGSEGGNAPAEPDNSGNGYDVPGPLDPNNPPPSTQVHYETPTWVPWTDRSRDDGWSEKHLWSLLGHCQDVQDELEEIRDDIRDGGSGGRWWTLQSGKQRVRALHRFWKKNECTELFDQVGR